MKSVGSELSLAMTRMKASFGQVMVTAVDGVRIYSSKFVLLYVDVSIR